MPTKIKLDNEELKDLLYTAQENLHEAVEALRDFVQATGDQNAKAYLVDHLEIMTSSDHGFLTRDLSVDDLIQRVESGEYSNS